MNSTLKNIGKDILINTRRLTASFRRMPDFIIIGTQKGGTTSLFDYLKQHPQTSMSIAKEVHYYDFNYHKGLSWYKAHFPFTSNKKLTGEASPFYIFHPHVPKRVFADLPKAKLILLLRDPVERAFSHYKMNVKNGKESLSFEEAVEKENERIKDDVEKMEKDELYFGEDYRLYSYITRGFYDEQIENWFKYFPTNQLLVIKSEDFFENTEKHVKNVFNFLGLPQYDKIIYEAKNQGSKGKIKKETKEKLRQVFETHNKKLSSITNQNFDW